MCNWKWPALACVVVWLCAPALFATAAAPDAIAESTQSEVLSDARIAELVGQLDDDSYAVREQATRRLVESGRAAIESLADAALSNSPESAWRATVALEQIGIAGDQQTVADVCAALERISREGNRAAAKTRSEMYARWRQFRHDAAALALRGLGGQLTLPQYDQAMGPGGAMFGGDVIIGGGFGPVMVRDFGGPIAIADAIEVEGLEFPVDPAIEDIAVAPDEDAHEHEHDADHRHEGAVEPAIPADPDAPADERIADGAEPVDGKLTAELIDKLIKEKLREAPLIDPDEPAAEGVAPAIARGGFGPDMGFDIAFAPAAGGGVVFWDGSGTTWAGGVLRLDKSWKGSDEDLTLLKDLAGVTLLELRDFTVTDETIKQIALMRDLRRVTMTNSQYPPTSLLALKKARPDLNVLAAGNALLGVSGNMGEQDGFTVNTVVSESGAGKAGIQPGDIITTIDGHDVRGFDALTILVAYKKVGQTIDLVFKRGDKTLSTTATLGPRQDDLP